MNETNDAKRATSKIGETPPETPPGIVHLNAELIDDSSSRFASLHKSKET